MPESRKHALACVRKGQLPLTAKQPQVKAEMAPQRETLRKHRKPRNWGTPRLCWWQTVARRYSNAFLSRENP